MDIFDKLFDAAVPFENDEEDCYFATLPDGRTLEGALKEVLISEVGAGSYVLESRGFYLDPDRRSRGNVFISWIDNNGNLKSDIFPWMD